MSSVADSWADTPTGRGTARVPRSAVRRAHDEGWRLGGDPVSVAATLAGAHGNDARTVSPDNVGRRRAVTRTHVSKVVTCL